MLASAKVNLTLQVRERRRDGYHELRSLVIGVGLYDRVACRTARDAGIEVDCTDKALRGRNNLAFTAAQRLAEHIGLNPGVRINIEKKIPLGAGLGGGSSDAASVLRLCDHLWGSGLTGDELACLGAGVGSDVPLFFSIPAARISGRGELVERMVMRWSGWAVLVFAGVLVPTADVYGAWSPADSRQNRDGVVEEVTRFDCADAIQAAAFNELEPAIFRVAPRVAEVKEELDRLGFAPMRVSGAGSALYHLYDEREPALDAAASIRARSLVDRVEVVAAPVGLSPIVSSEEF